jgi:hypothetical protein
MSSLSIPQKESFSFFQSFVSFMPSFQPINYLYNLPVATIVARLVRSCEKYALPHNQLPKCVQALQLGSSSFLSLMNNVGNAQEFQTK